MKKPSQPKTGERCHCKRGQQRDNCPDCEGTGMRIDFAKILTRNRPLVTALTELLADIDAGKGPTQ